MGDGSRLDAVLRAGENRRLSVPTGDAVTNQRSKASPGKGNVSKKAAKPAASAKQPAKQPRSNSVGTDEVANNQVVTEWMRQDWEALKKRVADEYKQHTAELDEARKAEVECADRHHKAVMLRDDAYKKSIEAAMQRIEKQLGQKNALLDECQKGDQGKDSRVKELEVQLLAAKEDHKQALVRLKEEAEKEAAKQALEANKKLEDEGEVVTALREQVARLTDTATKDNNDREKVRDQMQAYREQTVAQREAFENAKKAACEALAKAIATMDATTDPSASVAKSSTAV